MQKTKTNDATKMIQLDSGVLQKIMSNHNIDKPVLQVLNIRNISSVSQGDRYLLLLSDSVYFESACLLLPNLNGYIKTQKLKKDTIIQLEKYALNSIPNGKVLVIVDLTIINNDYPKIGNPIALTQKNIIQKTTTAGEQQQQQSSTATHHISGSVIMTSNININHLKSEPTNDDLCKCSNCQDKNTLKLCYKMLGLNESATKGMHRGALLLAYSLDRIICS
jgi:hypothetical protein